MFKKDALRVWIFLIVCLAMSPNLMGQSGTSRPNLSLQSGASWVQLRQDEKMLLVSGILLGSQYVAEKYDRLNHPSESVTSYMSQLFYTSNEDIVSALDRIYQVKRYWQVPMVKLIFENKIVLEELKHTDTIETVK